jgi:VanZ family protein
MNKKTVSLFISVVLTLLIFSMSVLSGAESGELSSGLSSYIKQIWDQIFINHPIALEDMNQIVRKGAHVFEYSLLGVSYYFTAKYWHLSILKAITIGLLTAGVDELIQSFIPERAGRWIDVLVFDLGGFIIGLYLMIIIFNRRQKTYEVSEVLKRIENDDISLNKAYKKIYHHDKKTLSFTDHAHFCKISIQIPNEPGVTKFLKVLFFIPFPLFLVRFALIFVKDRINDQFTKEDILQIIHSKGIKIAVNAASGEIVKIKIF